MSRRNISFVICTILSSICLTSCSYKAFEDSLRNPQQETESTDESYVNTASIASQGEGSKEDGQTDKEGNVFMPGETIKSPVGTGEMEYTLQKTEIVQNIYDLDLAPEDFSFSGKSPIDDSGNISESDGEKNYLLVAYITVKNCGIDISGEKEPYPLQIEMCSGSQSNVLTPDGPFLNFAVYFSAHPQDDTKRYYFFRLEQEEEMEVVLGWIVSERMLEEPYYYVINSQGDAEGYQYFQLNEK